MTTLPIKVQEVIQLTQAGIDLSSINFNSCTLESDKFICVRQKLREDAIPEVISINLKNNNEVTRRPFKADSALMHWNQQVIALKANRRALQIFDLGRRLKLQSATMNEDIVFWKWITAESLGLVTDTSVYHWSAFGNSTSPIKVFDRKSNLSGCQIMNYRVNEDDRWMVVVGISQQQGRVVGAMQLHSRERGMSQAIEAHAAAFGTVRLDKAPLDTRVFTFAVRTAAGAKLHVVEIDHQPSNPMFSNKAVDVYFPPEATNDFPVAMQVSQRYSIIYLVTKYGFIHLYDLETAACIFMNRISSETIFTSLVDSNSSGIICINRKGQVLSVSVDDNNIIRYLLQDPGNELLASKLASKIGLPDTYIRHKQHFDQCCAQEDYDEAIDVAANSPRGFLRTRQTLERFKKAAPILRELHPLRKYINTLLEKGSLDQFESIELMRLVSLKGRDHLIFEWLRTDVLQCSEELGDMVRPYHVKLALVIYLKASIPRKALATYAETAQFYETSPYIRQSGHQPNFAQLLQRLVGVNPGEVAGFATLVNEENESFVDIKLILHVFQPRNLMQEVIALLLSALKENKPEQGHLQTQLLELSLMTASKVTNMILGKKMFSYYHRHKIVDLCMKLKNSNSSSTGELATTFVYLNEYQSAVQCARNANSVQIWKQVNEACVTNKKFGLAQSCGLKLIVHEEELQNLVRQYENNGHGDELISLLEAGLSLKEAHMGMFTELGVALTKYYPVRVMKHLELFWSEINIPMTIHACEDAHLWRELVFLYQHHDEYDNAALAMMKRASYAWEHQQFKDIMIKIVNLEIYYRALEFYLQEQPQLITDLLQVLTARIDVNRAVRMFEKSDNIPLIKPFLLNVQKQNKSAVNNAINNLLIEEEDYKTLRDSVENYDNYNAVELASRLEKHELVFFRQIAASIYRKNKRWEKSIALSKQDKLFKDAIETSAMSGEIDVMESLLRYFVEIGSRECFAGMLYACYDLIGLEVVMEIVGRNDLTEIIIPFTISYMSQQASTIESLKKGNEERKAKEASERREDDNTPMLGGSRLMLTQGAASPMHYAQTNGISAQLTGCF